MELSRVSEPLSHMGNRLARLSTAISVRSRIIALAFIPVVGLGIIALAYWSGERQADAAFQSVRNSAVLAGASNEFRVALVDMRVTAQVFATRPTRALIDDFIEAHLLAQRSLGVIESTIGQSSIDILQLRENLSIIKTRFDSLIREQELLGFADTSGIEGAMRVAGSAVERIINQDMSSLPELQSKSLLASLSTMRRYEAEYRLNRTTYLQVWFFNEHSGFTKMLENGGGNADLKEQLGAEVASYVAAFRQWVEITDRSKPLLALIEIDSKNMMPVSDEIIGRARNQEATAIGAMTTSQSRTKSIIAGVGLVVLLAGFGLSWLIGRSITKPLAGLSGGKSVV